jgi:uncharacterized protein involved in exopolysaccharide biosynthesis
MEPDQTNQSFTIQDDTVDLKELFGLLWEGRKLIILITSVFALGSIFYALSLNNYYKSEAILSLAASSSGGGSALSAFSGLGGLASLAGISISSTNASKLALIVNTINSRAFLKHLVSVDENVLPSLTAAASYDSESKKLVFDSDVYDAANKKWIQAQPSYLQAYSVYMGQLNVNYDPLIRIIDISIEHLSPIFAKEFLDLVIREADALMRQKDLQQSSDALAYLTSEISKTSLVAMKSSMNQLVQSQLETHMMAKISSSYILQVIEPPFIPEIRSKPSSRSLICLLVTITGFVLSCLWILMRHFAFNEKSKA